MGRKDSPSNAGTSGEIRFGPQEEETHQSITTQVTIFNYSSILYLPQSLSKIRTTAKLIVSHREFCTRIFRGILFILFLLIHFFFCFILIRVKLYKSEGNVF